MGDSLAASSVPTAGAGPWGDVQLQGVMVNKTTPPVASPSEVLRQAICERALQAQQARVVLVRAPVGYGKTTALRQIRGRLSQLGVATGWLTLDRADNDLPRFLQALAWALAGVLPAGASGQLGPSGQSGAGALLNQLASSPRPFTLFLDDVEAIHDAQVLDVLKELIIHLPDGSRVMAASRSMPEWGLARLRVHGQLLEIDVQDLRFTQDEASSFFARRRHGPLPAAAMAELWRKTEGWIAAMWLASVALDRKGADSAFIASFSGSNKAVAHYLAKAVLAELPADVRQFLLRTSILHQMTVPLCHALTPRCEAQGLADMERMLDWLEEAEFFVRPVAQDGQDGVGRSWRYHGLFVDFLRDQLRRDQPHEYTRLHLAASAWFESQGRPVPAIDHALEGGDVPQALTLLSQHAQRFVEQGRMRMLTRWFTLIPSSQLVPYPLLESIAIWATFFTKGPAEALSALQRSGCESSTDTLVQAKLRTLRPLLMALLDRYEEALTLGRDALTQLPSGCSFSDIGLANAMAHVASVVGDAGMTRQLLDEARRTPRSNPFTRTFTESVEGMLDLHDGRLQQATARLRMAVGESGSAMPVVTPANQIEGNAWAGVLYAAALYDANRLDDAQQRLHVYSPLAKETGLPDHMILGHALRARIAYSRGDLDLCQEALSDLEYLGHQRQLPRAVAAAHLERARVLLLQGQARPARDALDAADLPGLWERVNRQRLVAHDIEYLQLARIRWELHHGDARRAVALIESELAAAEQVGRGRRALKLHLLLALGQQQCADIAGSIQTAERALRQACRDGFVRMVLDEGPVLLPVVQRLQRPHVADPAPDHGADHAAEYVGASRDPIWDDYLQTLVSALQDMGAAHQAHAEPLPAAREAELAGMTPQEIRVLHLLAQGCSNSDMASRLKVSDSTVRTHLRNINAKLGAHNRMQAIAAARRLAVIA
ncbi:LuxR C-terminal-related transcriptional regulator [Aquabacterium sp.]|uniref:LuxR C-terminal-related transcriptional regulator n=1 Tax=Aquabacterium sp. TaxID=1872578 RepID=UPI0025BEFD96|nr:LuxR C-terminal-related transcriptional regulator [Aquabacterium sp.]